VRKVDVDDVVFAGDRILQGIALTFPDTLDPEGALSPAPFDGDPRFGQGQPPERFRLHHRDGGQQSTSGLVKGGIPLI